MKQTRKWTPEEDALLRDGMSVQSRDGDGKVARLAEHLGRTVDSVKGHAKALGIRNNHVNLILDQGLTFDGLEDDVQQILLGSILGDGYLRHRNGRTYFKEEHEAKQRDYVQWKASLLSSLHGKFSDGGKKPSLWTPTAPLFDDLKHGFYGSTSGLKNRIPEEFAERLGILSLLVWYLDDGSVEWGKTCGASAMRIASKSFSRTDLDATCESLNRRLGLDLRVSSSRHREGVNHAVMIRAASRRVLLPAWLEEARRLSLPDCMRRKLCHPLGEERGVAYRWTSDA